MTGSEVQFREIVFPRDVYELSYHAALMLAIGGHAGESHL